MLVNRAGAADRKKYQPGRLTCNHIDSVFKPTSADYTPDYSPVTSRSRKSIRFRPTGSLFNGKLKTTSWHALVLPTAHLQLLTKLYLPHALRQLNRFFNRLPGLLEIPAFCIGRRQRIEHLGTCLAFRLE